MARNTLESARLLAASCRLLAERCVGGISADEQRCRALAESSPSIVTPLNRIIGYEAAAAVAKHALKQRITIREAVVELGHVDGDTLTDELLDRLLDVTSMTGPAAAQARA